MVRPQLDPASADPTRPKTDEEMLALVSRHFSTKLPLRCRAGLKLFQKQYEEEERLPKKQAASDKHEWVHALGPSFKKLVHFGCITIVNVITVVLTVRDCSYALTAIGPGLGWYVAQRAAQSRRSEPMRRQRT